MNRESFFAGYQKYVLALLPVFGAALTSVHQMGQFAFYEVPHQFIEFSTINTLISAVALTVTSAAALLSLAIAYNRDVRSWWQRVVQHIVLAAMLTGPFWFKSVSLSAAPSLPTIGLILLLAAAGLMAESYYRDVQSGDDSTLDLQKRTEKALHVLVFLGFTGLMCAFSHGYYHAKDRRSWIFIQGTDDLVVGSYNGRLVVKQYNRTTAQIDKNRTILLEPPDRLIVEEREARLMRNGR